MPDIFVSDKKEPPAKEKFKKIGELNEGDIEQAHLKNPLSSFFYLPDSIHFLNQDPEEKVVLFLRRHPITNFGAIVISLLLFLAPTTLGNFALFDILPPQYKVVFSLLWYLIAIAYVYEEFLDWFFSVFIVTDERVIDVDFVNLIYRQISTAEIDKIQDLTVQAGGATMAFFNYGNLFIQTAAEVENIEFERIPQPDKVSKIIRNLMIQEEQEKIEGRVR